MATQSMPLKGPSPLMKMHRNLALKEIMLMKENEFQHSS